jgi:5-methylcytosine-specific restriction endonuclease McrA
LRPDCKSCANKRLKTWYAENSEHRKVATRLYRITHTEQIRVRQKEWRLENSVRIKKKNREYYANNAEQIKRRVREWEENNPERVRELKRKWNRRHPEVKRVAVETRRARKKGAAGSYSSADVVLQLASQKGLCWWCGKAVGERYHVDHRIPLSRDGSNGPENICIACPECNLSKGNKLPHEWNGRLL